MTATLCHVNVMHLLFNMGSLFSVGVIEQVMGPAGYIRNTLLLVLLSEAIFLGISHAIVLRGPAEMAARFKEASAVGYSGVLFGWMTLMQTSQPGASISLPGGISLPFSVAPFVSLLINQIIVPQASFLGHLSGIFSGYAIAWGWTSWFTGYWFWTTMLYIAVAMLVSVSANPSSPRWLRRVVDVSPEFASATGLGASSEAAASTRRYMSGGVLRVVNSEAGGGLIELQAPSTAPSSSSSATAPRIPAAASAPRSSEAGGGSGLVAGVAPGGPGGALVAAYSQARMAATNLRSIFQSFRGGGGADGSGSDGSAAATGPYFAARQRDQPSDNGEGTGTSRQQALSETSSSRSGSSSAASVPGAGARPSFAASAAAAAHGSSSVNRSSSRGRRGGGQGAAAEGPGSGDDEDDERAPLVI